MLSKRIKRMMSDHSGDIDSLTFDVLQWASDVVAGKISDMRETRRLKVFEALTNNPHTKSQQDYYEFEGNQKLEELVYSVVYYI